MPCYSVRTMKVKIQAADRGLLKKALLSLGYQVDSDKETIWARRNRDSITITKNEVTLKQGLEKLVDEINIAYSRVVIAETAELFGMQIEEETPMSGEMVLLEYE